MSNSPPPPPPAPSVARPPAPPAPAPVQTTSSAVMSRKTFSIAPWTNGAAGQKIMIYAPSGMGKTTLAAQLPNNAFIGCDDGGRLIYNPLTGQPVLHVPEIETFADVRAVLQSNVFDACDHITIDTVTVLQEWGLPYTFATIKHEKGSTVTNIEGYGYGKGHSHLRDAMHMILADCDRLVRQGKNIILIAQEAGLAEKNATGEDYMKSGPRLANANNGNVRKDYIEWCDHVFRITWEGATIDKKKITPVSGRMINVKPDATFEAKSRGPVFAGVEAVSFANERDNSLWRMLFNMG